MKRFPPGFVQKFGGLVSCRAIKLLDGVEDGGVAMRDGWWAEIRREVREHARCLACNVIVGYAEETAIWDDVVVLCASGTAAVADLGAMLDLSGPGGGATGTFGPPFIASAAVSAARLELPPPPPPPPADCSLLHLPYRESSLPYT